MNQDQLLREIKEKALQDQQKRKDPRFLKTMGLLIAKGFLRTNQDIRPTPNERVQIEDAIWAGQEVEPRILEVLPAAVLRLEKHFDIDSENHPELTRVIAQLKKQEDQGDSFFGIPYPKLKVWIDFPLKDGRVKPFRKKKILKTFRLSPEAIQNLRAQAKLKNCTETELIEKLLSV